jgi:hypothetical protein
LTGTKEICQIDAISQTNVSYIPRVREVDGRDHDVAEEEPNPRVCLLDYRKAHIPVVNTVSVYKDVARALA